MALTTITSLGEIAEFLGTYQEEVDNDHKHKRLKIDPDLDGRVLYLATANYWDEFRDEVERRAECGLTKIMSLTKIGWSSSIKGAKKKIEGIQTYYPYVTFKAIFIVHALDGELIEGGTHFNNADVREAGEWFLLDSSRYASILGKMNAFGSRFMSFQTMFKDNIMSSVRNVPGKLYFAQKDWTMQQLSVLEDIRNDTNANQYSKDTAKIMQQSMKIGATSRSMEERGVSYIWATPFPRHIFEYFSVGNIYIEENNTQQKYNGKRVSGEWFLIDDDDMDEIRTRYNNGQIGSIGDWTRVGHLNRVSFRKLFRLIRMGLVTPLRALQMLVGGHVRLTM